MKKQDVVSILDKLPDEFESEDLFESLIVQVKLDEAEADIAAGRVYTDEEVEQITESWFK